MEYSLIFVTSQIVSHIFLCNYGETTPSMLAFFITTILPILIIYKTKSVVLNKKLWFFALSAKSIISTLVYFLFWYEPLIKLESLRLDYHDPNFQDSNVYDFYAFDAANKDLNTFFENISITWLSHGIISYLSLIYSVFGLSQSNILYFNQLFNFLSVFFLVLTLKSDLNGKIAFLTLTPYFLYFSVTPAKEVLLNCFAYGLIYFLRHEKTKTRKIWISLFSVLLGIIRINGLLLIYSFQIAKSFFKLNILKIILNLFVVVFITVIIFNSDSLFSIIDVQTYSNLIYNRQEKLDQSLSIQVAKFLYSNNFLYNILISPLRVIVWFIAPLPVLNLPASLQGIIFDPASRFLSGAQIFRICSSFFFLILIICVFLNPKRSSNRLKNLLKCKNFKYLVFFFCYASSLLSYFFLLEGARYRTFLEPILFLVLIALIQKK